MTEEPQNTVIKPWLIRRGGAYLCLACPIVEPYGAPIPERRGFAAVSLATASRYRLQCFLREHTTCGHHPWDLEDWAQPEEPPNV